jgi:hypothetical protein
MLYNVILNSSNVVSNTNNTQFKYKFLNGGLNIPENSEICMCSSIIPYPSTLTLTLNDGFYTTQTISNALESFFQFNDLFFSQTITTNGLQTTNIMYPITLSTNTNNYTNSFTFNYIPAVNPSGTAVATSTISGNVLTFSSTQYTTQGVFLSNNRNCCFTQYLYNRNWWFFNNL